MTIVIGGGPAGMMAAIFAARSGSEVILLERNEKLGKKLYITGKGRCNVTNTADEQQFMKNIMRNPKFMYSALNFFDNIALIEMLTALGVPTKVERGGRVFPESDRASDVTRALERELRYLGVQVRLNARVSHIESALAGLNSEGENVVMHDVCLNDGSRLTADSVILAMGGASYPVTGSDGAGARLASELDLKVKPLIPALTPIETVETWPYPLTGITLKNVTLSVKIGKKKLFSELGEMLFTHFGISGPLALSLSSCLPEECAGTQMLIDMKPGLTMDQLLLRIGREIDDGPRRQLCTMLDTLLPRAMSPVMAKLAGLDPTLTISQLDSHMRRAIAETLKAVPLTVKRLRGMDEAIITRGGVDVKQIDPGTLMLKQRPGLFVAGEMLDVDALTGGYNLQIAFSTGALAGKSAAEYGRDRNGR